MDTLVVGGAVVKVIVWAVLVIAWILSGAYLLREAAALAVERHTEEYMSR